jgi:hypothetical protein
MKFRQTILLLTAVSMIAALAACGGGSRSITSPPPTPVLADGTYVFSLAGQDAAAQYLYYVAGAFKIKGGTITGGGQDFVSFNVPTTLQDTISSGSVTTSADGNLQITLRTGDNSVGVGGVETLKGTLVSKLVPEPSSPSSTPQQHPAGNWIGKPVPRRLVAVTRSL